MRKAAAISFIYVTTAAGLVSAKDRSASAQAFMDVYSVLQHPRCMNCHPAADNPMHGDDSHPHAFGALTVSRTVAEDDLMLAALDAGAEDIVDEGDAWRVSCPPAELMKVRQGLEAAGLAYEGADLTLLAKTTVSVPTVESARRVLRLIDVLDDHDDVQDVYANFDIPDDILAEVDA